MLKYLLMFLCGHLLVLAQNRPHLTYSRNMLSNVITPLCEDGNGQPVDNPVLFRNGVHFMLRGNGVSTFMVNRSTEGEFECAGGASIDPSQRSQSMQYIVGKYWGIIDFRLLSMHDH